MATYTAGEAVVIHCMAGRHRATPWLGALSRLPRAEAQQRVEAARPGTAIGACLRQHCEPAALLERSLNLEAQTLHANPNPKP